MKVNFSLNRETCRFKKEIEKLYQEALVITGNPSEISVNVVLVGAEEIRDMNKTYRNVDRVTDVLSFPMLDDMGEIQNEADFAFGECNIGDIYINLDRAKEQANEYGHSLKREFCFLALHGFLHLLGYDHIEKDDEKEMFSLQDKILEKLQIGRD